MKAKVQKDGIVKEVDNSVIADYRCAGWEIVKEKNKQGNKDIKIENK